MLALIRDNEIVKQVRTNAMFEIDNLKITPAKDGWEGFGYFLKKIQPAEPIPEGYRVISKSIEIVDGIPKYVNELEPIPELTIEEQRARYPRLSMVDFRKKLRSLKVIKREDEEELDGIYEEDILEKISLIADKELQAEARDYFLYAQYIERTNPWIDILGAMFEISPEDIDKFWLA